LVKVAHVSHATGRAIALDPREWRVVLTTTAAKAAHATAAKAAHVAAAETAHVAAAEAAHVTEISASKVAVKAGTIKAAAVAAIPTVAAIPEAYIGAVTIAVAAVIRPVAIAVATRTVTVAVAAAVIGAGHARSEEAADYASRCCGAWIIAIVATIGIAMRATAGIAMDTMIDMEAPMDMCTRSVNAMSGVIPNVRRARRGKRSQKRKSCADG
jgi:hypothetical protein